MLFVLVVADNRDGDKKKYGKLYIICQRSKNICVGPEALNTHIYTKSQKGTKFFLLFHIFIRFNEFLLQKFTKLILRMKKEKK